MTGIVYGPLGTVYRICSSLQLLTKTGNCDIVFHLIISRSNIKRPMSSQITESNAQLLSIGANSTINHNMRLRIRTVPTLESIDSKEKL